MWMMEDCIGVVGVAAGVWADGRLGVGGVWAAVRLQGWWYHVSVHVVQMSAKR